MKTVSIDGTKIIDWETFHKTFAEVMGFPAFYGNNMDAWIDCMTDIDDAGAAMTTIHVARGEQLVLAVSSSPTMKDRCPEVWLALLECAAFVNFRRLEVGEPAFLIVSA